MASTHQSTSAPLSPPANSEPRLCWICQQDETEDESPTVVWKAPCPCSLTAHEECLLEWITAQETPRQGVQYYNRPIQCPQCQSEIKIQRPHDYLVQLYNAAHRSVSRCVLPAAMSGILGCVYSGCLIYGFNTIEVVFGPVEARNLLGGVIHYESLGAQWSSLMQKTLQWSLTVFDPFFPAVKANSNWKIFVGLPLIGPALIFARTRLADQAFPLLLPLYFLNPSHRSGDFLYPPLTPGLAFASLPYVTATYNKVYREFITPHEKRWDAAVQRTPREGETAADVAAQAQDNVEGPVIGIEFVEEIVEEDGVDLGAPAANGPIVDFDGPPIPGVEIPGLNENQGPPAATDAPAAGAPPAPGQQQAPGQAPNANDNNEGWQFRQDLPLRDVLASTMGALFFPTFASYAGEILYLTLPARLVTKSVGLRSNATTASSWTGGLLREKWGRTIVGGCLFVLLKDAVTLYVKWKKAREFGQRKILDYTGVRRRG